MGICAAVVLANKEPHNSAANAVEVANGNPALGITNLYASGNTMTVLTNIGNEDGGNVYTTKESIVKE